MGRARDIEAFARLLDGAPASSVPSSVAGLGHTVAALQALPVPALPASLSGGGAAFLAASAHVGTQGTRIAAVHAVQNAHAGLPAGTRIAGVPSSAGAKATAVASKVAATKATLFGVITAHLAPVVAGTAVLAVGVTGVAVGASRSLPGDPLYGLKRATESVHTATTTTRVSAAERRLDLATTRLHEALALQSGGGSPAHLAAELHEWMTEETAALTVLGPLAGTPAVKAKLAAFAAENGPALTAFPAATVAAATAAVTRITALLTPPLAELPVPSGKTVRPHPISLPSIAHLPTHVASAGPAQLPTALPSVTVSLPAPRAVLPSVAPTAGLPTAGLPTAGLPSLVPTALPTALPTLLPSAPAPLGSDVATLLQGLVPRH